MTTGPCRPNTTGYHVTGTRRRAERTAAAAQYRDRVLLLDVPLVQCSAPLAADCVLAVLSGVFFRCLAQCRQDSLMPGKQTLCIQLPGDRFNRQAPNPPPIRTKHDDMVPYQLGNASAGLAAAIGDVRATTRPASGVLGFLGKQRFNSRNRFRIRLPCLGQQQGPITQQLFLRHREHCLLHAVPGDRITT